MQDEDVARNLDSVDGAVRVAIVILDDLQDAGRAETVERLRLFLADLGQKKRIAKNVDDSDRATPANRVSNCRSSRVASRTATSLHGYIIPELV